jgi:transposase
VADRFHVIRLINHHFLTRWRAIDGVGAKNRRLLSLMRRHRHNLKEDQQLRLAAYLAQHPVLETISLQAAALLPAVEKTSQPQSTRFETLRSSCRAVPKNSLRSPVLPWIESLHFGSL